MNAQLLLVERNVHLYDLRNRLETVKSARKLAASTADPDTDRPFRRDDLDSVRTLAAGNGVYEAAIGTIRR